MGYLAIARKWRPSRFDDLVGQGHVVQTLKNAILLDRVFHAYLFSGARGVGKTSVARIFAKALRCPNAKDAISCNECRECVAISESRSVDVVEIDGASNNGVEAVRGIRENVAYGASSGHYKIYIIDEVHMLSLSAFNALLKTLEEPPEHVIFIFATTEVQKIPITILSRCQRFEFRRLSSLQIVDRLRFILTEEGAQVDEDGLRLLASHSDGSLRDALSLLDQVLSYFGEKRQTGAVIGEKEVVEALGINETGAISAFFERIFKGDIKGLVDLIGENYLAGVDLKHFAERCLEELRMLYLIALAEEGDSTLSADELDISAGHYTALKDMSGQIPVVRLERMAQILSKTISQLAWSSLPRFVLEMAAIRMSKLDGLERMEAALLKIGEGGGGLPHVEISAASAPKPAARVTAPTGPSSTTTTRAERAPQLAPAAPAAALQAAPAAASASSPDAAWRTFVDSVTKKRPLLGALLCHANFKLETNAGGKVVVLAFPGGGFYERQVSDTRNRASIEEALRSYFGPETTLSISTEATDTSRSIEQVTQAEAAVLKKSALEHPTVANMKEILGAEVVDVKVEI